MSAQIQLARTKELARLMVENADLQAKLKRILPYAWHNSDCPSTTLHNSPDGKYGECTCGYLEALDDD